MNTQFQAKFIQALANKKGNKGFTLIELLVVVIIIGVLAAIALPNLLGQVGKARESEAKSTVGAMTRAQQGYFTEKAAFASDQNLLEIPTGNEKYYFISVPAAGVQLAQGSSDAKTYTAAAGAAANQKNGTRDYISGILYDGVNRTFASAVCRADSSATSKGASYVIANSVVPTNAGNGNGSANMAVSCPTNTEVIK